MKNKFLNIMLILLSVSTLFMSCSKDDDVNQETGSNKVTPPAWIQGTWMNRTNPNMEEGYKFTSDDIITIVGTNQVSLKATLNANDNVSENETGSSYQITITHTTYNSSESWQFTLLDPTHIQAEHGGVTGTYLKE